MTSYILRAERVCALCERRIYIPLNRVCRVRHVHGKWAKGFSPLLEHQLVVTPQVTQVHKRITCSLSVISERVSAYTYTIISVPVFIQLGLFSNPFQNFELFEAKAYNIMV